ncbi:CpaB family protein [Paenibacillus puerhi]|uniref:hypothetical protein n=1 Tax=Paenibacillus puerhi TaxID=2692622 RepID=UPI001359921B|nr:hypothetical protein [Paenibacillus puerhi]
MLHKPWMVGALGALLMTGSVAGYWYFMKHTEISLHTIETVKPVRLLHSGEAIDATMLRVVRIAQAAHDPRASTDPQRLIGRRVVIPISSEEELSDWKLADIRVTPLPAERYFSFKTDTVMNVNNMVRRGDRVDVWVEFDKPLMVDTGSLQPTGIGAIKIIERLPVTSVKTAEGAEVVDTGTMEAIVLSDKTSLQEARARPSGKPETNTYIMSDEVYEAFVLGKIAGNIKLALPDLTSREEREGEGKVTELFTLLKGADAFSVKKEPVRVGSELPGSQTRPAEAAGQTSPPAPETTGKPAGTEAFREENKR